jgi:hypothetical protein
MVQKIESDKLFIKDIFKKWYRIPEYQTWNKVNLKGNHKDILVKLLGLYDIRLSYQEIDKVVQ